MSLTNIPDVGLENLAKNIKNGLLKAIDNPEVETFWISLNTLQIIEAEIIRRGGNPSDPKFGHDLMAEIAAIKAETMLG